MRRLPVEAIDRLRDFRFTNSPRKVFEGSAYLDRPVIDRTGIKGEYDFTFEFKPPNPGARWKSMTGYFPLMADRVDARSGGNVKGRRAQVEARAGDLAGS